MARLDDGDGAEGIEKQQPSKDAIFYAVTDYLEHQKFCNECGVCIGLVSQEWDSFCLEGRKILYWWAPE